MKPHSHDVGVARAFDCFCKKVLRNEARDYQDALARKRNREVYFSELPVEVLEQFAVRDTYFTDTAIMTRTMVIPAQASTVRASSVCLPTSRPGGSSVSL